VSKRPSSIFNDPGYFYSPRLLIRLFTLSSAALMIGILWWIWMDFDRPWKDEQRSEMRWEAHKLAVERFILEELTKSDRKRFAKQRAKARKKIAARQDEMARLDELIDAAQGAFYGSDMEYKEQKQYTSEAEYWVHEAPSKEKSRDWERTRKKEKDTEDRLRDVRQLANNDLRALLRQRKAFEQELDLIVAEERKDTRLNRLAIVRANIEKKKGFHPAREIPLLDFLAPPTKVEQIVLDDLVDNYEFASPKKVDRCGTCHIGSMRIGFEATTWPDGWRNNPSVFEPAVYRFVFDLLESVTPKVEATSRYAYEEGLQRKVRIHHDTLGLLFADYDEESGEIETKLVKKKIRKTWRTYKTSRGELTIADMFESVLAKMEGQWRTHSHFDDMVGANSPHPYERFGCSICHQGRGWSVDFGLAYHTPDRVQVDDWMTDERAEREGYHPPPNARQTLDEAMAAGSPSDYPLHTGWVTDEKKGDEWEEDRGWTESKRHYWHWPQLPKMLAQSSCLKCHREGLYRTAPPEYENIRIGAPDGDVPDSYDWEDHSLVENETQADLPNRIFIPKEPETYRPRNLERGLDNFLRFGCYGCHKLDPRIYPFMRNVRPKVGPQLNEIAVKTDKRWARKWIRNPKNFRNDTRMPRFWGLANNSHSFPYRFASKGYSDVNGEEWAEAEIYSIIEWIWDESAKRTGEVERLDLSMADAKRGEQLLVGDAQASKQNAKACIACHDLEIDTAALKYDPAKVADDYVAGRRQKTGWANRMARRQGPNLDGIGSKVTAEWLYSWLKNPRGYWHETNMPDLRLTDQEALDIVAHLMERKHKEFDDLPDVLRRQPAIDSIAEELRVAERKESTDEALGKVKEWGPHERTLYVGKKLFKHYGCFGCHLVEEYKNETPIGTELTEWGSKLIDRLEFNHAPLEKTRFDFAFTKLMNPRVYDLGMPRRDRPFERLKMSRFGFRPGDARDLATFLVGLVSDPVPKPSLFQPDQRQASIIRGRQIVTRYNCKSCHVIEGEGGDVWPAIADDKWRPPDLRGQGAKTQWPWLFKFLKDPAFVAIPGEPGTDRVRPWHSIRMPTFHFTDEEARALVRYFAALSEVPADFESEPADSLTGDVNQLATPKVITLSDPKDRTRRYQLTARTRLDEARGLFQEYQCKSCHSAGAPLANAAPDFRHTRAGRLRSEWIPVWLWGPLRLQPGTAMPMFFATEEGPVAQDPQFFDADAAEQIRALRDFIRHHYREEDR